METSGHDRLQFDLINAALDQEAEVERMIEIERGYGMLIKEVPDHLAQLQKYEEEEFNGVIQDGTERGHGRVLSVDICVLEVRSSDVAMPRGPSSLLRQCDLCEVLGSQLLTVETHFDDRRHVFRPEANEFCHEENSSGEAGNRSALRS